MSKPEVQTQAGQHEGRRPSSAGAKVTVACNLPHGLKLRNFKMIESRELVMGGGSRTVKVAEQIGDPIVILGTATEVGKTARAEIVAGYALTHGVDKEQWEHWLDANRDAPYVRNRCVFAYDSRDEAADAAKDHRRERTGLEPFRPASVSDDGKVRDQDPRAPRPRPNMSEVTRDQDTASGAV